jgi:hypothetical protein
MGSLQFSADARRQLVQELFEIISREWSAALTRLSLRAKRM